MPDASHVPESSSTLLPKNNLITGFKEFLLNERKKLIPLVLIVLAASLTLSLVFIQKNSFNKRALSLEASKPEVLGANTRQLVIGISIPEGLASKDGREEETLFALDQMAGPLSSGGLGKYPATFSIWTNFGLYNGQYSPRATFPSQTLLNGLDQRGITPVIFMQPVGPGIEKGGTNTQANALKYSNTSIANGSFDSFLDAWANAARAYGKPVILRYAHEMNGTWFPWSPTQDRNRYFDLNNTPASYIAAWKHVYNRIHAKAPNVKFFWCPDAGNIAYAESFFPGANFVDYIGFDSYERTTGKRTMSDLYAVTIQALRRMKNLPRNSDGTSKIPMIVGETGIVNNNTNRSKWLSDGYSQVYTRFPDLVAILYFNFNMKNLFGQLAENVDWSLSANPSMKPAYANLVLNPKFQGRFTKLPVPTITPTPIPTVKNGMYVAYFDSSSCQNLSGWTADLRSLNKSINVDVYYEDKLLTTLSANHLRDDVAKFLGDNGMHGFSMDIPSNLRDGKAHLFTLKNAGTNYNLGTYTKTLDTSCQ